MKRRYALVFLTLLVVNFALPRLMPGDPFTYLSVADGEVVTTFSPEQIGHYRAYYGLDKPMLSQFASYLANLLRGNMGYSIYYNQEVSRMIASRLPWTLGIVAASLVASCFAGGVLGALSAMRRRGRLDRVLYPVMVLFNEIPVFLLGIVLLFFLAAKLGAFPLSGGASPFARHATWWGAAGDLARHAALPVMTLALSRIGGFYLLARGSMLTVLTKDYMRTARGKGLSGARILFCHALPNALPPIVARAFMSVGGLIGGAVLVENVFAYPGMGRLMREAVLMRDYVLVQGIFLVIAFSVLFMNWLADLVYRRLDPRVAPA